MRCTRKSYWRFGLKSIAELIRAFRVPSGPGVVASSMACDHGERTYGDRLRSPTLTWLTGPTKQLSRSARRYT